MKQFKAPERVGWSQGRCAGTGSPCGSRNKEGAGVPEARIVAALVRVRQGAWLTWAHFHHREAAAEEQSMNNKLNS